MTDYRALCARMADELDYYRQLLMDDRREVHALATEARAAIAADRARRPAPQPPGDGQVAELVNHARSSNTQAVALAVALEQLADAADEYGPAGGADGKALSEAVKRARKTLNRAADLLERLKELEQVNSQPS